MRRALALARRGAGRTSPNPAVGAVLVHRGQVIGEGYHTRAGGAHAEIAALKDAQKRLNRRKQRKQRAGPPFPLLSPVKSRWSLPRGTVLYVTLEPCSTWGRTPPCVESIIAAGIKQVVIGATDPNPQHRGRGVRLLR
ncbi:hypothetical protein HQ590_12165, partial [bacterium]|nr:hypothetical protein [bacterium]